MHVPLLDLKKQYEPLRDQVRAKMDEIASSQYFILGPEVEGLEREICEFTGAGHAIGVSSGTDAELAILMALGVGAGDVVITTPYTFFATAGGIARLGARIVFVDIEPETFNISVEGLRAALEGNGNVKAIMPVHLFGLSCGMDEICGLAAAHRVPVIEDAAQALGAEYPRGAGVERCGAMGEFGFYSFFPSKNLGAFGDAGMVVCKDGEMAEKIRRLRNHGMEQRYYHHVVGGNFRIDALQAAILRIKLPHLNRWSAMRRANAAAYREEFERVDAGNFLTVPAEPYAGSAGVAPNHHIYNQYVIRAERRDDLLKHLAGTGIGHAVYYPVPLHLQECFAGLGYKAGDFPEAERAARETVALPVFPELTREEIGAVVGAITEFYSRG